MLIRKAYDALNPGGAFVVYDSIIDDDRSQNAFGLMMSLNMLIETPGGFDYSGADWPIVRHDGVVELNAHYMIEADDGARIYIRNMGYVHGPLRATGQPEGESPAIPGYFRCTPYFRAPIGPHDWLNRTVVVGVGQRRPKLKPVWVQKDALGMRSECPARGRFGPKVSGHE